MLSYTLANFSYAKPADLAPEIYSDAQARMNKELGAYFIQCEIEAIQGIIQNLRSTPIKIDTLQLLDARIKPLESLVSQSNLSQSTRDFCLQLTLKLLEAKELIKTEKKSEDLLYYTKLVEKSYAKHLQVWKDTPISNTLKQSVLSRVISKLSEADRQILLSQQKGEFANITHYEKYVKELEEKKAQWEQKKAVPKPTAESIALMEAVFPQLFDCRKRFIQTQKQLGQRTGYLSNIKLSYALPILKSYFPKGSEPAIFSEYWNANIAELEKELIANPDAEYILSGSSSKNAQSDAARQIELAFENLCNNWANWDIANARSVDFANIPIYLSLDADDASIQSDAQLRLLEIIQDAWEN